MSKSIESAGLRLDFVTLFPDMVEAALNYSILKRAQDRGAFQARFINPRDFADGKRRKVDDKPYGGGVGMVLMADPVQRAIESVLKKDGRVIFLSPQGRRLDQKTAERLSKEKHLILVCGHYEGLDERLRTSFDEEISIGDYVLTGGELPALVLADAVIRLIPGVLKKSEAVLQESFSLPRLDFPHYTRPRVWRRKKVPEVLLSGSHERISRWRNRQAITSTRRKRPDLLRRST